MIKWEGNDKVGGECDEVGGEMAEKEDEDDRTGKEVIKQGSGRDGRTAALDLIGASNRDDRRGDQDNK